MSASSVQPLRDALQKTSRGAITEQAGHIIGLLADCWSEIAGAHVTSMTASKLDRAEKLSWSPPILSFTVERHGATVLGSTRAELQEWEVDLDLAIARHIGGRHRQLVPAAPRLDVNPIATRVCDVVQQGPASECDLVKAGTVTWLADREVVIKHGDLIPNTGFEYRQTLAGRRARLRRELTDRMTALGWQLVSVGRSMKFTRM
jgi:hypothetical protein